MLRFDASDWCRALRSAAQEHDWTRLLLLDRQLNRILTSRTQPLDPAGCDALRQVYREVLALRQAEAAVLQRKLAELNQQYEVQLAYAQVSDWEST